jgi:tRNA(Ile)-lysidine synthase
LLQETREYIQRAIKIGKNDKILLTLSGGIDSMVMSSILIELGYPLAIAHCNFSLRGDESDSDQEFVNEFAGKKKIPVFNRTFDTADYARTRGLSIQMAARELRYKWFSELSEQEGIPFIAVAHNLDDVVETFILNLVRGTGLRGLTGIKPRSGKIIRPLLFASRKEIEQYAMMHKIEYREDSSNLSTAYHRNRIRHNVIPELLKINPAFSKTLEATIEKLSGTADIFDTYISSVKERIIRKDEDNIYVTVNDLAGLSPSSSWLFEIFREYGISQNQLDELKKLFYAESGKYLSTSSHTIFKDRERLIISPDKEPEFSPFVFNSLSELINYQGFITETIPIEDFEMIEDSAPACLDLSKISFPLTLRTWKEGDFFFPLGLRGKKKISDFLIDLKIPLVNKAGIRVLCSNEDICWVAGFRIDNRFRVRPDTKNVLLIRLSNDILS